ncbi:hypothetical protein ALP68_200299 [Pseudomonas ficuserectae]|nr:hypothetical protein ALP67_200048 [Pseudomonas ficuserectae]RMS36744.1 hypothetical protein ALP68_200299 [Pseudomonas ficuserectae]
MGCVSSTSRSTGYYSGYESHDEPRVASSPANRHDRGYETDSEHSNDNLIPNARRVYKESVLWHGTSMQSKIDLRRQGFDVNRKTDGATEGSRTSNSAPTDTLIRNARRHNYLTAYDVTAKNYARRADPESPALVRTIGVKSNFNIELDPESKDENGEISQFSCRTTDSIPKKYIVGSKSSQPGADAKVFKTELSNAGFEVSTSRAGELLRAVQSDSEDDF